MHLIRLLRNVTATFVSFIRKSSKNDVIDMYFGLYEIALKDAGHVRKRKGIEVK